MSLLTRSRHFNCTNLTLQLHISIPELHSLCRTAHWNSPVAAHFHFVPRRIRLQGFPSIHSTASSSAEWSPDKPSTSSSFVKGHESTSSGSRHREHVSESVRRYLRPQCPCVDSTQERTGCLSRPWLSTQIGLISSGVTKNSGTLHKYLTTALHP